MGMDPYTAMAIGQLGSAGLSGLLQGDPYQQRESFTDTGADPVSWLSDARASIGNVLQSVGARAGEDVNVGGDMELAPSPTFSGSGLPWDISGPQMNTPKRVTVSGFNLGPIGNGSQSSLPQTAFGKPPSADTQAAAEHLQQLVDKGLPLIENNGVTYLPGHGGVIKGDVAKAYNQNKNKAQSGVGTTPTSAAPATVSDVPAPVVPPSPQSTSLPGHGGVINQQQIQGLAAARLLQSALTGGAA